MLRLRLFSDAQKRSKNGQPPHRTTGVASASWTQTAVRIDMKAQPNSSMPMARITSGADKAALIQNRRFMSMSSGFGPSSRLGSSGSSAIPQIGQLPGWSWRIWGCIGQVQIVPSATAAESISAASWAPW